MNLPFGASTHPSPSSVRAASTLEHTPRPSDQFVSDPATSPSNPLTKAHDPRLKVRGPRTYVLGPWPSDRGSGFRFQGSGKVAGKVLTVDL